MGQVSGGHEGKRVRLFMYKKISDDQWSCPFHILEIPVGKTPRNLLWKSNFGFKDADVCRERDAKYISYPNPILPLIRLDLLWIADNGSALADLQESDTRVIVDVSSLIIYRRPT